MDVRGTAPRTRRSGLTVGGRIAPLAVLAVAVLLTAVALARLDPVYHEVPGVYRSWQLLPGFLDLRHEAGQLRRELTGESVADDYPADQREEEAVASLRAALATLSDDVAVLSWQEEPRRTVAVGVAEVEDAPERVSEPARELPPGAAVSAWAVEGRFVVAVIVTGPEPHGERVALAEATTEDVEASIAAARVLWWQAIALGPFLLLLVLAGVLYVAWVLVWIAFQLLKVLFYLVVLLPLSLLGLREPTTRPLLSGLRRDPFERLVAGIELVDLDRVELPPRHGAVAWLTALVLAVAVAIPALTTSLWTTSLVWGALGVALALVWLGRGAKDPWARAARWAVAAVAVVELAHVLLGLGPGLPTDSPAALAVALLLVGGAVAAAWRRAAAPGSLPSYVPWYADLDLRSAAYLAGLAAIVLAGGALFLGSNGDLELGSQLTSKALALAGLVTVPIVGRRVRAARDAARREWAREREVPEVLLLRSFVDDGLKVPSRPQSRHGFERLIPARRELFEDVIVRAFTQLGPVMAIGKPGTGQSELGASRDLILGADWLSAVKAEMADAAYIVVLLGRGEGLTLELETLRELGLLDRVCLVVPPVDAGDAAERLGQGTAEVDGPHGWGLLAADHVREPVFGYRNEVLALLALGERRCVVISKQREATSYLRLGAFVADQLHRMKV